MCPSHNILKLLTTIVLGVIFTMKRLMTKYFAKWAKKQNLPDPELLNALLEMEDGHYDAGLGGHVYKKRIRFKEMGKSGSGRTIICYKRSDRAIFIHGFAKNEKVNITTKELLAFKELAKVLLSLSMSEIDKALLNGDFVEVK